MALPIPQEVSDALHSRAAGTTRLADMRGCDFRLRYARMADRFQRELSLWCEEKRVETRGIPPRDRTCDRDRILAARDVPRSRRDRCEFRSAGRPDSGPNRSPGLPGNLHLS